MQRSRRRTRRTLAAPEVTLTPLIDTALTLLVIFMVTAPLINNSIKIDLPTGKAKEDKGIQQELVVYMDQGTKIFFNGKAVSSKSRLLDLIKKAVNGQRDRMVFVKADKLASYGAVLELVDDIKMVGGVSYVALATKKA